jgi:3-oxoacid CoA-transferase
MATAAKCVIVEAEEIVEEGELDPNNIHVSGVYVDKVIKAELLEKRIEKLTLSEENVKHEESLRDVIARRAVKEIKNGMYVNLGIGIPTLVPQYLPEGITITL